MIQDLLHSAVLWIYSSKKFLWMFYTLIEDAVACSPVPLDYVLTPTINIPAEPCNVHPDKKESLRHLVGTFSGGETLQ